MQNSGSGQGETFAVLGPPGVLPKVTSIFDFSADALAQLRLWLEQNPPAIGISNVLGFSQFTAQPTTYVATFESTTSTSYTDLATVGPSLTGLPNGQYLVLIAAGIGSTNTSFAAQMSVSVNGGAASDNDAIFSSTVGLTAVSGFSLQKLTAGNNSIVSKYKSNDAATTAEFDFRKITALKYANA